MLVCGIKKVYEYLEKNKVEKIYITNNFRDKDILNFIKLINKDEEEIEIFYVERDELDEMTGKKFDEHQDIVAETKNIVPFVLILIVSTALLLFITIGLSFSLYSIVHKVDVDTGVGKVILNYSDINGKGSGINIENALSVSDDIGMKLTGNGNYFDFTVSGKSSNIPLRYYVLLNINEESTLDDVNVKVYLTKMKGTIEEKVLEKTYKVSELEDFQFNGEINKILYIKDYSEKDNEFIDNYRLRMWISDDAVDYYNKKYSIKVNLYGEGR